MLCVSVYPFRPEKDLQIAEQMADNKKYQNDSRDRDDELFADGSLVKSGRSVTCKDSATHSHAE